MLSHCVSYNEVRQFLTSVSAGQITRSGDISDRGMIHAAIDNFDQNEETFDGKQTVIYRRGQTTTEVHRLARIPLCH